MSQTQDQPEPQQGISLDELTEAFAQVMGTEPRVKPEPEEPHEVETDESVGEPRPQPEPPQDDPCPLCPRTILEAMLFVGNWDSRPLGAVRAVELMRGVEPEDVPALVNELNRDYAANGCPYHVVNDGSGYRLALRKAFHPLRNRFYGRVRQARLSQAAIDVLAIVAYQQPLSSEQISRIRGKPGSQVLAQLVRRGLLRIEREETKRQTFQYFTTDRFLKLFGMETLDDLPRSEDLDRL